MPLIERYHHYASEVARLGLEPLALLELVLAWVVLLRLLEPIHLVAGGTR